jgi:cytochrome P450
MSTSVDTGVPFLNIVDPEFDFSSPEVTAAQERSWYAESPIGLLVLRYAQGRALLRDQRLDHNGKRYMELSGVLDGPIHDWFVPMIVNHDGESHRRLRGLVSKAFNPRMVNELRPFVRARTLELAESLAAAGECEFVEGFCNPLPLAVMCELLGVPPEDYDTFRVWTTDIGLVFSLAYGGDIPRRVEKAVLGLNGYVEALMTDKKATPGEDLISALVAVQQEDDAVSWEELRNLIVTLVFAAHDTTRHQFANAMVAFAGHPEQWDVLAAHPELTGQAVEEVMRWLPASATAYRFAKQDFDFEGLHLTENTFLTVCTRPAQRDPRVFAHGEKFDITVTREAPLLLFGAGPHHCLGVALARVELSEALPVLAGRLGPPVVTGSFTWRPAIGIYGPTALPLRFG